MTKGIIISVISGLLFGLFLAPDILVVLSDTIISCVLIFLLFTVGVDLGMQDGLWEGVKKEGFGIFLMPLAVIMGTLLFGTLTALVLPYSFEEMLAVSSGLGWYSLAPAILVKYSSELGAVSFLHNVLRELTAIILIPIVAKKIGWLETISLPGAASMDVCLPIVERCTSPRIALYSFVSGAVLTLIIPFMITGIMETFLM